MIRSIRANDSQWVEWIKASNLEDQKKWAKIFGFTSLVFTLVSICGLLGQRVEFIGFLFLGVVYFFTALAKYNNYRLYGIIQKLTYHEGRSL